MATTYIVKDETEQRISFGDWRQVDNILAALNGDPLDIDGFECAYRRVSGQEFYREVDSQFPKEIPVETLKNVFRMNGVHTDEEVLEHWEKTRLSDDKDAILAKGGYLSFSPDERTEYDIPARDCELLDRKARAKRNGENFAGLLEFRLSLAGEGIVVVDLRRNKRAITYLSANDIERNGLPEEWKIEVKPTESGPYSNVAEDGKMKMDADLTSGREEGRGVRGFSLAEDTCTFSDLLEEVTEVLED